MYVQVKAKTKLISRYDRRKGFVQNVSALLDPLNFSNRFIDLIFLSHRYFGFYKYYHVSFLTMFVKWLPGYLISRFGYQVSIYFN